MVHLGQILLSGGLDLGVHLGLAALILGLDHVLGLAGVKGVDDLLQLTQHGLAVEGPDHDLDGAFGLGTPISTGVSGGLGIGGLGIGTLRAGGLGVAGLLAAGIAASNQSEHHNQSQQQCNDLLHFFILLF